MKPLPPAQPAQPASRLHLPPPASEIGLGCDDVLQLGSIYGILEQRQVSALFQPVIDLGRCEILGYEALIRGPSDSTLHSPIKLLRLAHHSGLAYEVEMLCAESIVAAFLQQNLQGRLFLNFSPNVLLLQGLLNRGAVDRFAELGLSPEQVILEVAEHGYHSEYSRDMLQSAIRRYRKQGFAIALDDLGEGSSNFRLWGEVRPDFVKLDRHLIQGIDKDERKSAFVTHILDQANQAGARLIAEGVETRAELKACQTLGIELGQGYFLGRPVAHPSPIISAEVTYTLRSADFRQGQEGAEAAASALSDIERLLLIPAPAVLPETPNEQVFHLFEQDEALLAVAVVDANQVPLGLITRYQMIDRFARPYRHELYGRKPCTTFMDPQPLVIDKAMSILELSQVVANAEGRHIANGFVIADSGRYLGVGTTQQLMRVIADMQIQMAKHANPLTQLPGNVPIMHEIDRLLREQASFCACYVDLDHFKPFNDVYGFSKGDDIIRLCAQVLISVADPERDFIGHIGGDDFIVLFHSEDWESRCQQALADFGELVAGFFSADDRDRGGYVTENRKGQPEFHPLVSVSIGAIPIQSGMFATYLDLTKAAAEAKKKAKGIAGNSLFVNQRQYRIEDERGEAGEGSEAGGEVPAPAAGVLPA